MNYYVIQVKTNNEESFVNTAKKKELLKDFNFIWLRKSTTIRKGGICKNVTVSIFPGYIFTDIDTVSGEIFAAIKENPGFLKFLNSNKNIIPLSDKDKEILLHFLSFGKIIGKSQVAYSEDMRIQVLSGPLKGLDGNIVKVDRRKKKAKVLIDLYDTSFAITMDFEVISSIKRDVPGK